MWECVAHEWCPPNKIKGVAQVVVSKKKLRIVLPTETQIPEANSQIHTHVY